MVTVTIAHSQEVYRRCWRPRREGSARVRKARGVIVAVVAVDKPVCSSTRDGATGSVLEGTAGVTNVGHGHDVDATARKPVVTFGEVTTIEVT
jgi:hypothetical protein